MNKARKQFLFAAMLAIFILLTALLGVINVVDFTMAASDADHVTEQIEMNHGSIVSEKKPLQPNGMDGRMGPMGPDAPDMGSSLRYFTYAVDDKGNSALVEYRISAVSEQEAMSWAESLKDGTTGWTHGTYRYRVYRFDNKTYVTVIDQGREMLSAYRILIISVIGEVIALIVGGVLLILVSRKLFRPLEEADRRQKTFLMNAEKEFKVPLTVISADTELLEREHGSSTETASINRQLGKMKGLVETLGSFAVFEGDEETKEAANISEAVTAGVNLREALFTEKNIPLTKEIAEGLTMAADPESFRRIAEELLLNASKFSAKDAKITLKTENGRLILETENDTTLPDGDYPQAFDRFTRLENAEGVEGAGLGLSYVREKVLELNGRVHATAKDGRFTVRLSIPNTERRRS